MITWDDLAIELNKANDEVEKAIKVFESLKKTYQELIDYYKEIQEKNGS